MALIKTYFLIIKRQKHEEFRVLVVLFCYIVLFCLHKTKFRSPEIVYTVMLHGSRILEPVLSELASPTQFHSKVLRMS